MKHSNESITIDRLVEDYLSTSGWLESIRRNESRDLQGPLPWFTYAATRYLARIVRPDSRVLEFGAGNSTLWWSTRVTEVVSVEHDPTWADLVRRSLLPNVRVVECSMGSPNSSRNSEVLMREFHPLRLAPRESPDPTRNYRAGLIDYGFDAYACALLDYPSGYFDIIVIDGMARVLTTWLAARQLASDGLIIFDNSDRVEYVDAYRHLEGSGFARVDFSGLGPLNTYEWSTSIFFKSLAAISKYRS